MLVDVLFIGIDFCDKSEQNRNEHPAVDDGDQVSVGVFLLLCTVKFTCNSLVTLWPMCGRGCRLM